MKRIIFLLALLALTKTIQFSIDVEKGQKFCVYEVFNMNQKYSFAAASPQSIQFMAQVQYSESKKWNQVFMKNVTQAPFRARADKIASSSNMYMFCLTNTSPSMAKFDFQLDTGLEIMELHELATDSDAENLQKQVGLLKDQTQILEKRTNNIEGLRQIGKQAAEMIGTKMIFFAFTGLILIALVNFMFFRSLKKTFKQRKLI